jgi:transposase-like protein
MKKLSFLPTGNQVETGSVQEIFRGILRQATYDLLCDVMAEELSLLCGAKYSPSEGKGVVRSGTAPGFVRIQGQKRKIIRPRVRKKTAGGKSEEVSLLSYRLAQDAEYIKAQIAVALGAGVSARELSGVVLGKKQRGLSKSQVSRLWEKEGLKFVDKLRSRDLSKESWAVLMLDGIRLAKDLLAIVALGINSAGEKFILDFEIGSSENEITCTELVNRLVKRGFKPPLGARLLCILDGAKALKNAVLKQFPSTIFQRCLVHKARNIRAKLSKKQWGKVEEYFADLRKSEDLKEAIEVRKSLRNFLEKHSTQAVASLDEAGEDLLAFWKIGAPHELKTTLLSTNIIENSFRNTRRKLGRVSRWRAETDQPSRWLAYALLEAEKGFQKITGYQAMDKLLHALQKKEG